MSAVKAFFFALAGVGLSAMLALVGAVVIALGSGNSPVGVERSVVATTAFEGLIWVIGITAYFSINRPLPMAPRVLATIGFALANLLGLLVAFGVALVATKH